MEWKKLLDECCADELEEQIINSIKAGFLSDEEIQEECEVYIEEDYPEDVGKITEDDFAIIISEFRHKFGNVGTQEHFLKLDLAFQNMEKRGIVTAHCAGYTLSDGFEDCNEDASERYEAGEKVIGCCFYTMQDLERVFRDEFCNRSSLLYFGFGNYFDEPTAEEVGQIIVEELEKVGFSIEWNGSADKRIAITNLVWDKQYTDDDSL